MIVLSRAAYLVPIRVEPEEELLLLPQVRRDPPQKNREEDTCNVDQRPSALKEANLKETACYITAR